MFFPHTLSLLFSLLSLFSLFSLLSLMFVQRRVQVSRQADLYLFLFCNFFFFFRIALPLPKILPRKVSLLLVFIFVGKTPGSWPDGLMKSSCPILLCQYVNRNYSLSFPMDVFLVFRPDFSENQSLLSPTLFSLLISLLISSLLSTHTESWILFTQSWWFFGRYNEKNKILFAHLGPFT